LNWDWAWAPELVKERSPHFYLSAFCHCTSAIPSALRRCCSASIPPDDARRAKQPRVTPTREQAQRKGVSLTASVHDDQIHALVQQLFFRHESKPVRHVGFATVDASTETAALCLESPELWLKKASTT
jgi:hypothetical protein